MKRKQFVKGIPQLAEEGAIPETFLRTETGLEEFMVGVVGVFQFDVLTYRLKSEYGVDLVMERLPLSLRALGGEFPVAVEDLQLTSTSGRGFDAEEQQVLLFEINGASVWPARITRAWSWRKRRIDCK